MSCLRKSISYVVVLFVLIFIGCSSDGDLLDQVLNDPEAAVENTNDTNPPTEVEPESSTEEGGNSTDPEYNFDDAVTTESLGWQANEDVTEKLKSYLENPTNNKLCISHLYKLSADGIVLPDNFTLCAEKGAGFSLIDVQNANGPFLEIGDNSLWYNVSILSDEALAPENEVMSNNKRAVQISNGNQISIVNCKFATNAKSHLDIRGVTNLTLKGTHFDYGYYQILLRASSSDILIEDCLFSNSYGDGIKTQRSGINGVKDITVKNTVYEYNKRDGLDTTGGFRNGLVTNCIFRNNGVSGMDIKSIYENENDMGEEGTRGNDHILIKDSEFIDQNNAIVLTTLDRNEPKQINDDNHAYYLPNNISFENSIIENNSDNQKRVWLIKDAHTISWDGLQLLGPITLERTFGLRDPNLQNDATRPDISRTNYDIGGTNVTTGSARGVNLEYPYSQIGPR